MLKASEDKTFPGAIVASLASPWGQAVSAGDPANTYFGSYREVFARDLYEAWTGLVADGDLAHRARRDAASCSSASSCPTARCRATASSTARPRPTRSARSSTRCAYPILMAHAARADRRRRSTQNHIKPAANFVAAHGPSFGVERWEEQSGFSPSTIAAEIAGLVAAADLARRERRPGLGRGLARRRRRLPALDQGLDGDDERAARAAPVLHPALEDRRPERRDLLQRRQRRPDARPARGDRRRLPRARAARRAARERPRRPRARCRSSTRRSSRTTRERRRLAPLQRRRLRRPRDRRPAVGADAARAPGTCGRCCRPSAPSRRSRPATRPARRRCSTAWRSSRPASGSSPSRTGSCPISPASPFGTDPTIASIGFVERQAGRLGRAADLVGGVVRPARARPRRRAQRSTGRPYTLDRYVAHTQGTTTLTVTRPADNALGRRLAGHGHRHDRARQHGLRRGHEHRRRTRRRRSPRRRPPPTARSASTSR